MIWLASFPRSGNTYFRNILKKVYGVDSSYDDEAGWERSPVVKTHRLPYNISELKPDDKIIYLVRDGRDATVSLGHHMKDIAKSGDHLINNMVESMVAAEESYFGGWSNHVYHWIQRADVVIRYEDLVAQPIEELERLRKIMDLPPAKPDALPSFESLKKAEVPYGIVKKEWEADPQIAQKFYRKGKSGAWRSEMPQDILQLFHFYHGDILDALGYGRDQLLPRGEFEISLEKLRKRNEVDRHVKVLIEAQKLMDPYHDGVYRYIYSLTKAMKRMIRHRGEWQDLQIDLLINGIIQPLYTPMSQFVPKDKPRIAKIKDRLWQWHGKWPKWLKTTSVRMVNLYFTLKTHINIWRNRHALDQYNVLHLSLPQNYYFLRFAKRPKWLATVHDMTHSILPEYHLKRNIRNAERGMREIEDRQANVIAVSEATRQDVEKYSKVNPKQVHVIHEAVDRERFVKIFDPKKLEAVLDKYGLRAGNYIFMLATLEPRKNMERSIAAFLAYKRANPKSKTKLAIGGKKGWKAKLGIEGQEDILALGYVPEEDLSGLYTGARFFMYASLYEGFGLPLLEAMRCGSPVIYGRNSSMMEMVADAGLGVDATSEQDITDAISELDQSDELRMKMAEKAWTRSLAFSWDAAARQTMVLYRDLDR